MKFVINSLETLKVMADPNRLRILEEMIEGPRTVKQPACARNDRYQALLSHQFAGRARVIRVIGTWVVYGIMEKLYHVSAYSYPMDKSLLRWLSRPRKRASRRYYRAYWTIRNGDKTRF